jgi:pimeloyl-ACP methyl ester carboxylesterase
MKRKSAIFALCLLCFVIAGGVDVFAKGPPPEYFVDESKLPFDALAGTDTQRYWGIQGHAAYQIEVPANWNGSLVMYCHGYRGDLLELTVSKPSIRSFLIESGYAWAASSYSKNGYQVATGVKDTHNLAMFFNGLVGKPDHVYIMGHSMGGHVVAVSIEQYPKTYDGALPMCGVMGDYELFDYFMDYHLLAAYLTGTDVEPPFTQDYVTTNIPAMKAILGPVWPYVLSPAGQNLKTAVKYLSGGQRPLYDVAFMSYANFLFTQIVSPDYTENINTIYQLDDDMANMSDGEMLLNAMIYRHDTLPKYPKPNGLAEIPVVSGKIPIPVLSMHTLGDLFVPFSMQQIYAQRVADFGKSEMLVQRAIRDVGHCGFTPDEEVEAFIDLIMWVEEGVKPEGDNVLDPAIVANGNFGCQFTSSDRSYAPPCPTP